MFSPDKIGLVKGDKPPKEKIYEKVKAKWGEKYAWRFKPKKDRLPKIKKLKASQTTGKEQKTEANQQP